MQACKWVIFATGTVRLWLRPSVRPKAVLGVDPGVGGLLGFIDLWLIRVFKKPKKLNFTQINVFLWFFTYGNSHFFAIAH